MKSGIFFAIPFYAGFRYLEEALKSLLKQDSAEWRAAVIDDSGSREGALFVDETLARLGDKRIECLRNPKNLGIGPTWNRGLDVAQERGFGKVTLLHEDDRLLPEYVSVMSESFATKPDAALIAPNVVVIDQNGAPIQPFRDWYRFWIRPSQVKKTGSELYLMQDESGLARILKGHFFYCPSICYNLEQIGTERFREDLGSALDLEFFCRLVLNGKTLVALPSKPLFEYRRHDQSTTESLTATRQKFQEELAVFQWATAEAKKKSWDRAAFWGRMRPSYRLHLTYAKLRG